MGEKALPLDKFMLTLGIRNAAKNSMSYIKPEIMKILEAYAKGINTYAQKLPVLPTEFIILGTEFDNWTPLDSITLSKFLNFHLSFSN